MSARKIIVSTGLLAGLFGLAACDDVKSPTFIPELKRIQVCPAPDNDLAQCSVNSCTSGNAIVPVGGQVQFCAIGFFEGLNNADVSIPAPAPRNITDTVIWSLPQNQSAVASISQTGLVAALAESPAVTITAARGDADPGTAQLRITPAQLQSLEVTPPLVQRTVPGQLTQFACTGRFSGPPACPQVDPRSCDLTDEVDWTQGDDDIFQVNNVDRKGLGTAVAPGRTEVLCETTVEGEPLQSEPAPVTVCDAALDSLTIQPAGPLNLISGQTRQLTLRGTFTGTCGGGSEQTFTQDLTLAADWQSDRPEVVAVGNSLASDDDAADKGRLEAGVPGLAEITAGFDGQQASIDVFSINGELEELRVTGPNVVFPGFSVQLTATPFFRNAETGELEAGEEVTVSPDTLWSTNRPAALSIPDNDGLAIAAQDATPQPVGVTAVHQGVSSAPFIVTILNAELIDVQVTPSLGCISTLDLIGSAAQRQYTATGIFSATPPGAEEAVQCAAPVTERAEWVAADPEALSGSGSDLLSLIDGLLGMELVGGCQPLLPIAVGADPQASPAIVSNAPGTKGLVTANPDALLPLLGVTIGTACIQASVGELTGQGTALVAIDIVPEVCSGLEVGTETLLNDGSPAPNCAEAFAPEEEETAEESGGLLGPLLGGKR